MSHEFNPKSVDAVLAKILAQIDQLDRNLGTHRVELNAKLEQISGDVVGLGNRVTTLEQERWYQRGVVAAVAVGVAVAWEWVSGKLFK